MRDKLFNIIYWLSGFVILFLVIGFLLTLTKQSIPALSEFGVFNFYTSSAWDPGEGRENFGALPFIAGSVTTAFLAILFALPFTFALIAINESYVRERKIEKIINVLIEFTTTIPAVVWGIWGFYILRPLLASVNIGSQGYGILCASLVLAIMIIPYAASYSILFVRKIPQKIRENAYTLGATESDIVWKINFPFARKGILSAHLIAWGKALGEAMIATILIGNANQVPSGWSDTGNTMTSIIINQIGSVSNLKLSALFAIALLLFLFTAGVNAFAKRLIQKI